MSLGREAISHDEFALRKFGKGRVPKTMIVAMARSVLQTHTERSSI